MVAVLYTATDVETASSVQKLKKLRLVTALHAQCSLAGTSRPFDLLLVRSHMTHAAHSCLGMCRLITAVKTPYLPNGKFDLRAYDALLEHQIQHGVEGVIVGGTTGEGQLMGWDEHVSPFTLSFISTLPHLVHTHIKQTEEARFRTENGALNNWLAHRSSGSSVSVIPVCTDASCRLHGTCMRGTSGWPGPHLSIYVCPLQDCMPIFQSPDHLAH